MATILWRGDAPATAQVNTITPASVGVGNTFNVTINGKTIAYTAPASTISDVCSGLQSLLAASAIPEYLQVTWTNTGSTITGTAKSPGVAFIQISSATGGTATLTTAVTTASAGPKDWSTAANWSSGSLPASGDDVVFANSTNDCLYGLDQHAVTLNSLTIEQSYGGKLGNARQNGSGSSAYLEYRPLYLQVGATTITLGNGSGGGSGRIKIDTGSARTTLNLNNSGAPAEAGVRAVLWKGTHASNVVNLVKGSFAAAYLAGESATIATLSVGYLTNQTNDVDCLCGAGTSLGAIVKTGGSLEINSGFSSLSHGPGNAGELILSAGTAGSMTLTGGNVRYRSDGNYSSLTITGKGLVDFSQNPRPLNGANTTLNEGGTLKDPGKRVSFTNPIAINASLADVTLDLGGSFNLQRS